jgi:indoleamine 2,3-dioxygenase
MSPHALTPPAHASGRQSSVFEESEIETNGFLPGQLPLTLLPDPYYGPWESLVRNLSKIIKDKTVRLLVHELPVLSVSRLKTAPEWRRAYVILSFLAHGYIWGDDHPAEVSTILKLNWHMSSL